MDTVLLGGSGFLAEASHILKTNMWLTYVCSVLGMTPIGFVIEKVYVWIDDKYPPIRRPREEGKPPAHEPDLRRVKYIGQVVGCVERAVITTLVIWLPSTVGNFMAGWIALKTVGGWGSLKDGGATARGHYMVSLVASLSSLFWAAGLGLLASPCFPVGCK